MSGTVVTRPKGWRLFVAALRTRKSASMLALGFSSGLPNALLIGTLTAWPACARRRTGTFVSRCQNSTAN